MDKKRRYSIAYLICLVLLVNSLPFSLFIDNEVVLFIINLIIKIGSIIYILLYIKKEELNKLQTGKLNKNVFKLIPLILVCCSNFIVVLIQQATLKVDVDVFKIISGFLLAIGVSIIEELLFRSQVLEEFLKSKNKFQSILYTSIIFGMVHLLNISSLSSIPTVLVQVCYTFFLGVLVGFIYLSSKNIVLPIIYHLLFNFLNDILVAELFNIKWDLLFFIVNIGIGLFALIYILLLLKLPKERDDICASKNMDN